MTTTASLPNLNQLLHIVQDGINIVQVGIGGTGGTVAMNILKLIGGMEKDLQSRIRYIGIDGDEFEEKNLGRQLCIRPDMGKNKAKIVVGRYSNAFGVGDSCASFLDEYITGPDDIIRYMHPGFTNIIIDNLDKNKPRVWLHDAVKQFVAKYKIAYVYEISTGNGEWAGQVTMGCCHKVNSTILRHTPGTTIMDAPYYFSVPSPFVVHPNLLDVTVDEKEEAMSCADRAVNNVQTLVANNTAATICFNYVNSIFTQFINQVNGKEDVPQTIGTVRFNAKTNGYQVEQLTDAYLNREVL